MRPLPMGSVVLAASLLTACADTELGSIHSAPYAADGSVAEDLGDPDAGFAPLPSEPAVVPPDNAGTACSAVRITTVGLSLNVRAMPSLDSEVVATLGEGTVVAVLGSGTGDDVDGERTWYRVETALATGWITARFAECTTDPPSFGAFDGFRLPLACGMSARISQGNNTTFSHQGTSAYAFDFSLARGTPLHAMADGVAIYVENDTGPGDPCYDGGGPECAGAANSVQLLHADGTVTIYVHLEEALVERGQTVPAGAIVGRSGSTGYSTGPHAHVARTENCGRSWCSSIPLSFADVAGDGIPATGDTVTSANCP